MQDKMNDWKRYDGFRRGDIYLADLNGTALGSEQHGVRPVLVLQNNKGNLFSPTIIIAPLTSRKQERHMLPTHRKLRDVEGLNHQSVVMLEQIRTIDKRRVTGYIGRISEKEMERVETAMKVSLGFIVPPEPEAP